MTKVQIFAIFIKPEHRLKRIVNHKKTINFILRRLVVPGNAEHKSCIKTHLYSMHMRWPCSQSSSSQSESPQPRGPQKIVRNQQNQSDNFIERVDFQTRKLYRVSYNKHLKLCSSVNMNWCFLWTIKERIENRFYDKN